MTDENGFIDSIITVLDNNMTALLVFFALIFFKKPISDLLSRVTSLMFKSSDKEFKIETEVPPYKSKITDE
ncbi:hypothetical protein, partial [Shewanella sp. MBTL60-007]|uniref:hypothetical protein n=1 Tax=Shewanella sp. MBTL60-007 TaxID=2815911 RepID=UPI001C81C501